MTDSLLASKLREYFAERRATFTQHVMGGACTTMEEYRANTGAYNEVLDAEAQISTILKEINDGV